MKYEKPVDTVANRLKYAMSVRDIKQSDLIIETGISSGSLSQYVNGRVSPKQDRIYILAKALGVDETWLMGFDVPMDRKIKKLTEKNNVDYTGISSDEAYIVEMYSKLDSKNKIAIKTFLENLTN